MDKRDQPKNQVAPEEAFPQLHVAVFEIERSWMCLFKSVSNVLGSDITAQSNNHQHRANPQRQSSVQRRHLRAKVLHRIHRNRLDPHGCCKCDCERLGIRTNDCSNLGKIPTVECVSELRVDCRQLFRGLTKVGPDIAEGGLKFCQSLTHSR